MGALDAFYDINPVQHITKNQWTVHHAELKLQFQQMPIVYTPLVDWIPESQMRDGASTHIYTEMMDGDVNIDELPQNANFIGVNTSIDTRSRSTTSRRYGDKVQLHKNEDLFQQFDINGSRNWQPLFRGLLGQNVIKKMELLARNSFFLQPKEFWTFSGGGTSFSDIGSSDTFSIEMLDQWNLTLGQTGSPVIPGDSASAKIVTIPPSAVYAFNQGLAAATNNKSSMWRDAQLYAGRELKYELGMMENIRFVQTPNDNYGMNSNILYNCGEITVQAGVTTEINVGDGAPDPEGTFKVDDVWSVGQPDARHYVQLAAGTDMTKFSLRDIVTIHVERTNYFGITNGVDFRKGRTVNRRIVAIDADNCRLSFDRPVLFNYKSAFRDGTSSFYAYVTKARHIGFSLVMGSRGGVVAKVDKPFEFYEPKPVDDFNSVWRFVWDTNIGYNLWDPNKFQLHFFAVHLPKPGGIIAP